MNHMTPKMDNQNEFQALTEEFEFPSSPITYLNGNSLGPKPKNTNTYVLRQLDIWKKHLVKAQNETIRPWVNYQESLRQRLAMFLGTSASQIMLMNALTVNLHLALISFYQPTPKRYKIIYLKGFPSDAYALRSQVQQRLDTLKAFLCDTPFDIEDALIPIEYDKNFFISDESIAALLEKHGAQTVLLMIDGVHYQTGQAFDIQKIAAMASRYGVLVGVDLAHMIGNIPIQLNQMNIDFAIWCHYKYMNAGPGAIGGFYVHQKHLHQAQLTKLHGWWGVPLEKRFLMSDDFIEDPSAAAWALSNSNLLSLCILEASLDIFEKIDMQRCFEKSLKLGQYLIELLNQELKDIVEVITPPIRGCQLSLKFNHPMPLDDIEKQLHTRNIYCDIRPPILRVAPNGLYNTDKDAYHFVEALKAILSSK